MVSASVIYTEGHYELIIDSTEPVSEFKRYRLTSEEIRLLCASLDDAIRLEVFDKG